MPQFNTTPYNVGLYGIEGTDAAVYSTDLIVFDDFSLSDGSTYVVTSIQDSGPTREIVGGDVPQDHGRFITGDFFREKEIEVQGYIKVSGSTLLLPAMDALRKALRKRERNLDLTYGTTVRRYTATLTNHDTLFPLREHWQITMIPFTARFACKTPFATDRDYTSTSLTLSVSPTNQFIYNSGTAIARPIVTLLFDAASSVTVVNVKRIEPDSGDTIEEIEYAGSLAAGGTLAFNSEDKTVRKNSADADYTGSFLTLEPGGNLLKFTITASSFSAPTTIRHKGAYL